MRKKQTAACFCTCLLLAVAGCGASDMAPEQKTDITANNVHDESGQTDHNEYSTEEPASQTDTGNTAGPASQTDTKNTAEPTSQTDIELEGNIESIGDNSIVINKTFHPSSNEAVSYQNSEKELITVYFSEETKFEIWNIKNSGINGDSDIDKKEGTASDMAEDLFVKLTGNYVENDFYSKQIILCLFS
ncbi:MAG: hypothetical protein HFG80_13130 [Eubacterium sp.]|nr:hypothetical protein [Eubacterium sp.]